MDPALGMTLLFLLFGGTHIGLATRRVRGALVARLGEGGFIVTFFVVASLSFAAAASYYAAHRWEGAPGLALAGVPVLRWLLMAVIVSGILFMSAGSVVYPGSPYDQFGGPVRSPRGIERISRHPFFTGVALFAMAHAFLATRLIGTVVFGGLALLAIAGARHQDAKLLAHRGRPYGEYLAATSAIPFVAILAGRQRVAWRELSLGALVVGAAVAVGLRTVHDGIFAHGGAWVIGTVVGGALVFTWASWRRAQRAGTVRRHSAARSVSA